MQYVVQLSAECERILAKYGWTLPKIGNADYNKCLKALGAAVGIEKKMHSHLGTALIRNEDDGEPCGDSECVADAWGIRASHRHNDMRRCCRSLSLRTLRGLKMSNNYKTKKQ